METEDSQIVANAIVRALKRFDGQLRISEIRGERLDEFVAEVSRTLVRPVCTNGGEGNPLERAVIEAFPMGVALANAAGEILMVNQESARLFGYSRSELIGKHVELLVPTCLAFEQRHQRADLFGVKKDGQRLSLECGSTSISTPHGAGILCLFVDVTQQKRKTRTLMERSQELQRANRRLTEFASLISHDLKAPLITILGYSQRCLEQHEESLGPQTTSYTKRIVAAAQHMQEMIDHVRRFSELEVEGSSTIVNVTEIVEEMLGDIKFTLESARVAVLLNPLPKVWGQGSLLRHLFQNLVENAVKFRRANAPASVRIEGNIVDGMARFSVKDNGIGIPREGRNNIFQKFSKLHRSSDYEGSGIGLAICDQIVKRLGGRIWVESEVGEGSTFTFTVPMAAGPLPAPSANSESEE